MCMTTMVFNEFFAGFTSQQNNFWALRPLHPYFPRQPVGWEIAHSWLKCSHRVLALAGCQQVRSCTRQPSAPHHEAVSKLIWQLWSLNDIREHEGTNSRLQFPDSSKRVSSHDAFFLKKHFSCCCSKFPTILCKLSVCAALAIQHIA